MSSRQEPAAAPTDTPPVNRPTLRVLVAEDNETNQLVATLVLAKMGYDADVAQQRGGSRRGRDAAAIRRRADGRADARDGRTPGDRDDPIDVAGG